MRVCLLESSDFSDNENLYTSWREAAVARVLRSGRRLSTAEAGEGWKQQHQTRSAANVGKEFIDIIVDRNFVESKSLRKGTDKRPNGVLSLNEETQQMDTNKKIVDHSNGRRWGIVYQRKRKRLDAKDVDSVISSDRRYGIQFSRQRVKRLRGSQAICQLQIIRGGGGDMIFSVFLNSILSYMSRVGVTLQQLSEFLLSDPICIVYSMHDIHFLQNSTSNTSSGVCRIMGSRSSVPMFTLNYSAVPSVFMLLHTSLLLRSATFPKSNGVKVDADSMIGDEEMLSCNISEFDNSGGGTPVSIISSSVKRSVPWGAATPKTTARTLQLRTVNSRGVQKRSSLRLRRGRNLSSFVGRKVAGVHPHTAMSFTNDGLFSVVKSSQEIISPIGESFKRNFKEFKPTMDASAEILDASRCYANLLVIEADKCYREQDAMVTLEYSSSNKWFVGIRTYGAREYNFKAEKVMRPSTCNRVTKAIVWTTDNGWKLEFCNKSDWLIFKRLYKECFERNVEAPSGSGIPVPCVVEVCPDGQNNILPFKRPESYIEWKDDELTRALREGATNYDMDSEDEIWLNKFNIENDFDKPISAETFELIISSFEKGAFCIQDDYLDVEAAVRLCISVERREVLEAVHSYWRKKRKQKRSSLVRVFQCYQPRRAEALTKAVLRKRRSFSRQASKTGRGKQRTLLQAMAAERNTIDEQKIILKVQEANAATYRSEDVAIHKRKRAQMLIDVADKYTYKAAMALRISEAIKQKKSLIDFAKFFLV